MDEEPIKNSNGIVDPAEPEATAPVSEDASPAAGEAAPVTTAAPGTGTGTSGITGEKVLDIAFGVAVIAGEALDKAAQRLSERAKEMQEQAPGFWDTAEERGRPVREKLVSTLRGTTATTATTAEGAAPAPATGGNGLADSLRSLGKDIGITVGGGNARLSAEDEIRSLEDRVRELEQVVVSGKTGIEPEVPEAPEAPEAPEVLEASEIPETPVSTEASAPVQTEAPLSENTPESLQAAEETETTTTTAEANSYAFGEDQHEDILAASPYAVSETDDERAIETTANADDVESVPQGEVAPPAPPASTGRASRKKQRDFDPEATDENTPTPEA
jgi:hypothetical protein